MKVDDIYLAATLMLTYGIPKTEPNKDNPKFVSFIFPESAEIKDTVNKFQNNELKVNPLALKFNIRNLKGMCDGRIKLS